MTDPERSCLDMFLLSYGKCGEKYTEGEWLGKLDSFIEGWAWAKSHAAKNEALKALIEDVETDAKGRDEQ